MRDLDRELRDLAGIRDAHSRSDSDLSSMKRRVFGKARRRRFFKAGAGVTGTAMLVVALLSVPMPFASSDDGPSAAASNAGSSEGLGFWPTVIEDEARDLCETMDLRGAHVVAVTFTSELLGWGNVSINEADGTGVDPDGERTGDSAIITVNNVPRTFGSGESDALPGGALPPRSSIAVTTERLGNRDCWWVTGIASDQATMKAERDGNAVSVTFDIPESSVRAEVVIVDVDSPGRQYLVAEPGETSVRVDGFDGPGYVVVLWKSSDGWTTTAAGELLP